MISSPVIKKDNELGEEDDPEDKKVSPSKPKAIPNENTSVPKKLDKDIKKNVKAGKNAPKKPLESVEIKQGVDSLLKDSTLMDSLQLLKRLSPYQKILS